MIETSRYAKQISEYYRRFSADSILLLNFEDLKANTLNEVKKVCQFLDINPNYNFQKLGEVHNPNQGRIGGDPVWRSLRRIKPLYFMAQLISVEKKQKLYSFFASQIDGNIKLYPEEKIYILEELKDDLQKLELEYGFDISRWNIKI